MNHYAVYRADLKAAGKRPSESGEPVDTFDVALIPRAIVPARSVADAIIIAKALGHCLPVVEPLRRGEETVQ